METYLITSVPLRKIYTEQMFVLLPTKRMQLRNHADKQRVKRSQHKKGYSIYTVLSWKCARMRPLRKLSGGTAQGRIQPVTLGGAISTKFGFQSHYGFTTVREIKYRLRNTTVTKQQTAKWLHIMKNGFISYHAVLPNCTKSWWLNYFRRF